ncbi:GLUG motif-containing protein, partial [Geofilum sp. OHC36d9]|uniref:GLUG motif-containing protein n=1 Tax=Geofilum sp. OHC36d9 TaxID=3458413 RepID=UPI004033EB56
MQQKLLLFIALWLIAAKSVWTQTAIAPTGGGTESDPYQVASIENLYWISQTTAEWNAFFEQTADIDASETSTWNGGDGFSPIGNSKTKFTGNYNGQGYTINNLTINRPSTDYVGLFGYSYGATINNLGLTNITVKGGMHVGSLLGYNYKSSQVNNCYAAGSVSGSIYIGGLVGGNNFSSQVNNCYSTGSVSGSNYIGGLVGFNNFSSQVNNCYSTGPVSGSNNVGGLVGCNYDSSQINNCYSTGSVSGSSIAGGLVASNNASTISYSYYNSEKSGQTSGLGFDDNSQTVTALTTCLMKQSSSFPDWDFENIWEITEGTSFPRLIGVADAPVILPVLRKFAKADVEYRDTIQVIVMDNPDATLELLQSPEGMLLTQDSVLTWTPTVCGDYEVEIKVNDAYGLQNTYIYTLTVTELDGQGTVDNPLTITSLNDLKYLSEASSLWDKIFYFEQTANIDASETSMWNDGKGFSPIGNSTIMFTGNYNGQGYTINNLTINRPSTGYVGLFGYINGAIINSLGLTNVSIIGYGSVGGLVGSNYPSSQIINCYSTGTVSGNNNVGGLVGYNRYSSQVNNCYSTATVSGSTKVGGLLGYNYNSSSVNNCYSIGSVSGSTNVGGLVGYNYSSSSVNNCYSTGSVSGGYYVGGLVGYNGYSNVNDSYYNNETSGQTSGLGLDNNSQTVTALTTKQMKQRSSFPDWDFSETWDMVDDKTYPALLNVNNNAPFAFADTLEVGAGIDLTASVLSNDYDYETAQNLLTYKIVDYPGKGSINSGVYSFNAETPLGTSDVITYCVGELIAEGETLWGSSATAILKKVNSVPELIAVRDTSINEGTSVALSLSDVSASDADNDELSLVITEGENYTLDSYTIIPGTDFYGTLSVGIAVTDGDLISDTLTMTITVIAVPDTTIITWGSPEDGVYGTAIGSDAMNATASNTEGVITYSFSADSIFDAGTYELIATYAPNNSKDYTATSDTVEYTVNKLPITVTADAGQSKTYGEADPVLTYTVSP